MNKNEGVWVLLLLRLLLRQSNILPEPRPASAMLDQAIDEPAAFMRAANAYPQGE